MRHQLLIGTLSLLTIACAPACGEPEPEILPTDNAISVGDSILAWNREAGQSIGALVGQELDLQLADVAIGGAQVLGGETPIPNQYESRAWELVIVDGGGNDIGDACNEVTDALVSEDLSSGAMAQLVDRALGDGAGLVVLLGYYGIPSDESFPCPENFTALEERYAALAEDRERVIFVDPSDVVSKDDLSMYDADLVHPSPKGSRTVADYIVQRVNAEFEGEGEGEGEGAGE